MRHLLTAVAVGVAVLSWASPAARTEPAPAAETPQQLLDQGRLPEAEAAVDALLKQDPDATAARRQHAQILLRTARPAEAIAEYERLYALAPNDRELQLEMAWALTQGGEFRRAIQIYDQVLRASPAVVDIHLRRALALFGAGDLPRAIRAYERVLELEPGNLEARVAQKEIEALLPKPADLFAGVVLCVILAVVLIGLLLLAVARRIWPARPDDANARDERAVRTVAVVSLAVAAYYLFWRLTHSVNWDALWFSVPVFLAELYGVATACLFFFMCWRPTQRTPPPPPLDRSVDVFITTYNESPEILRKTILGCLAIRYPHATYVLDDGNRPEIAALARALGCGYFARTDNTHAKAGNLNHALRRTQGEFIATFDADHVPLPQFLDRTLGFFTDEAVAFVQTPQDFYNIDSYQHRLSRRTHTVWTEQSLFFAVIQPGKDRWNSAFYCGSCAVLRRSALAAIGGFAEGTVTEDIHTSILLHAQGFRSVYLNESLAYGLAPDSVRPFLVQRLRWGQGAMQVLRRANPLRLRGLTLAQRLSYFTSMTTYFDGYQKTVYYLAPLVYFTTGVLPIVAFDVVFLLHFIPYIALFLLGFEMVARGAGSTRLTEQYNMSKFFTMIRTTHGLFARKPLQFHTTPKTATGGSNLRLLWPQAAVIVLTVIGITIGGIRYFVLGDLVPLAFYGNLFWAVIILGLGSAVMRFTQRKIQQRDEFRFPFLLPCRFSRGPDAGGGLGLLRNCHENGAAVITFAPLAEGTAVHLTFELGDQTISAAGIVVRCAPVAPNGPTAFQENVRFTRIGRRERDLLIRYGFELVVPRMMLALRQPPPLLERLTSLLRRDQRQQRRWPLALPTTISVEGALDSEIRVVTSDVSQAAVAVVCSQDLPLFGGVRLSIRLPGQEISMHGDVVRVEPIAFGGYRIHRYVVSLADAGLATGSLRRLRLLSHLSQPV